MGPIFGDVGSLSVYKRWSSNSESTSLVVRPDAVPFDPELRPPTDTRSTLVSEANNGRLLLLEWSWRKLRLTAAVVRYVLFVCCGRPSPSPSPLQAFGCWFDKAMVLLLLLLLYLLVVVLLRFPVRYEGGVSVVWRRRPDPGSRLSQNPKTTSESRPLISIGLVVA